MKKFEEWIHDQRGLHLPNARPLSPEEKSRLGGYFEARILDLARLAIVGHIQNPRFYNSLKKSGIPIPLDFSTAVGLSLIDCILIRKELQPGTTAFISTLFHEMVHVVQVDTLGLKRHIELYADSLSQNDYQYHSVVLETQAYAIGDRFDRGEPPFSVREAIRQELDCGK